jgi:choline dehydrogenase-like flavoprotein
MGSPSDSVDVLIVGGGTSGGVAAKHFAENGFSVVCLEQGDWVNASDLPGDKPEYELLGNKQWHPDPNERQRPEDYPVENSEADLIPWMYSGVGGTSILYAGCWSRLLPSDFRVRTLDGIADDWPLTYEELQPFYEQVDVEMGVSGLGGNPAYPPGAGPPLPPHPINPIGRKMAEAMNRLGWHWWPGYVSIPSQEYGNQKQCVRYGICRMGCPEGSKASTDLTHWPLAQKHGARVVTGARVSRIEVNEKGLATGATYIDRDGAEHFQAASVVVMAANGIGTPRLLLMSGIANSSGLVGKRLMMHPYGTIVGIYDDFLEDWLGPAGEEIESMQFYETDKSRGFVRGAKWQAMPTGGPLGTVRRWADGESVAEEPLWGQPFTARMKESIGHTLEIATIAEDLPTESNRVRLDASLKDSDGLPAPKVIYTTEENTHRILDWNCEKALEVHAAAGAKRAWIHGRMWSAGHLLGTTRMGDDPASSVVDRYGRAHDVSNLYIVDGSIFVTSGAVNPTATICALAKRCATYVVKHAREQAVAT